MPLPISTRPGLRPLKPLPGPLGIPRRRVPGHVQGRAWTSGRSCPGGTSRSGGLLEPSAWSVRSSSRGAWLAGSGPGPALQAKAPLGQSLFTKVNARETAASFQRLSSEDRSPRPLGLPLPAAQPTGLA